MQKTILLVDDQAFVRHIYSADLRNKGFEVICTDSGLTALEIIKNNRIDLILLDAVMPGLDGFDTCKKIRETEEHKIPVIFLTANADRRSVIKAVQAGANDYFVKCPETASLIVKIEKFLTGA